MFCLKYNPLELYASPLSIKIVSGLLSSSLLSLFRRLDRSTIALSELLAFQPGVLSILVQVSEEPASICTLAGYIEVPVGVLMALRSVHYLNIPR